ncbi:alkaline phosphatase family protein [Lysinibacillus sp. KU-BSD001]|uniref:alkaline phosphatase family protein n=1 Tax=Lysinibacillus sp. KU-BSD001 TaxID=3141328 RepID=UPI0036E734E5
MNSKSKHEKYVIVISYDAFSQDNWEMASQQPNLSKLIGNGAWTTKLKSVYPTLTYVIHTSYVTGVYPNKHGIYHNNPFQPFIPEEDQSWHWFRRDIKVRTVYEEAMKRGMKVAGILWPVSGKASIQYNMPEIKAIKNENQALKILKNGSPFYSMRMEYKYGRYRKGVEQPYLDDFSTMCAVDTIKRKKPNLLLLHLIELDDTKHALGTKGEHIEQAIRRMDKRLGDLMHAVEEAGIKEHTTFIVVGDHGQLDVRYKVYLNRLLKDNGLIYEENGEMRWRAYVQGAGGAAYLHVREGDPEAQVRALEVLERALAEDRYGIESIFGRNELDGLHVDNAFHYMLEAKEGYAFEDAADEPIIVDLHQGGIKYATHGYSPNKPNYTSVLVISGEAVKNQFELGEVEVIDIAPTIATILGINFTDCDGRALTDIFKTNGVTV